MLLSFVPTPFTVAMIAIDMPAAIRPYSIAVAQDSSFRKALNVCMTPVVSTPAVFVLLLRSQKGPDRVAVGRGKDLQGRGKPAAELGVALA